MMLVIPALTMGSVLAVAAEGPPLASARDVNELIGVTGLEERQKLAEGARHKDLLPSAWPGTA